MRFDLSKYGIRHQLWGLFGLFLLTGALVLVLDEAGQYSARRSMIAMKDDVLDGMRRIRRLSDAYSRDVVDTTFKARNSLVEWDAALATVEQAQVTIDAEWQALQASEFAGDDDRALLQQALQARARADAAVDTLRHALRAEDVRALGRFADGELYPAVDPLTDRLQMLAERGQFRADALVQREIVRGKWLSRSRLVLSLLCLALVVVVGRRVLRNGYRGVESLTELSRKMAQHDYTAQPHYRPTGELGEVLDSFLQMRSHVQRIETQLKDQLASNDRVRIALERREHFQRLLLEAAQTAILAVDEDGTFSQVNPFAEQMLGWPAGSLLGREKMDAILDPDALLALSRHLSEAYGQPIAADWTALRALAQHREPPREFVLRHQRGRTLPVLLALSAMRDDTGAMVGLLAVATDLTALKRLERALRDSEARARDASQAKSAFLAAMSHEIRTPMIGVTGMIEVLSHTQLDVEQRRSLNVIQASAETLLRIIGDILDFSKIEAGRMEIEPVPTSLPELMRSVVANYAGSASSKGLSLTCDVDPRVAPAHYADPVRVRQVIGNFLSNAIKFTERGSISVRARRQEEDRQSILVCFEVRDTGIGVPADAIERLFSKFEQADNSMTREYGGTGLGLAIVKQIADLMGGSAGVESREGAGSTFWFTVRLKKAIARKAASMVSTVAPGTTAGEAQERRHANRRILIVDDEVTNREVILAIVEAVGLLADCATSGHEAVELAGKTPYDLILMDLHMARMDGMEATRRIRRLPTGTRTPILALTGNVVSEIRQHCLNAGMNDFVAKPFSMDALLEVITYWLRSPAAEQATLWPTEPHPPQGV